MEYEYISQGIGFLAFIAQMLGYFLLKNPRHILTLQSVTSILWAVHFVMFGYMTVAVVFLAVAIRNIISVYLPQHTLKNFLIGYVLCISTVTVALADIPIDYAPLFGIVLGAIACLNRDRRIFFFAVSLCSCTSWVLIHMYTGSISGLMSEAFMWFSMAFALHRAYQDQSQEQKLHPTNGQLAAAE